MSIVRSVGEGNGEGEGEHPMSRVTQGRRRDWETTRPWDLEPGDYSERRCPDCDVPLEWRAPSVGHTGDLYRCPSCNGYIMLGEVVGPRN